MRNDGSQIRVINQFRFVSYIALFDMHHASGRKYATQKAESVSAVSDEEARANACAKAEELTKRDKDGDRYECVELKKVETHHILTSIRI